MCIFNSFPPHLIQGTANTTRKILKKKKRADTQYDNSSRFDGQRFGKLKVAAGNVKGTEEKTEELKTELLKRKSDIAIIFKLMLRNLREKRVPKFRLFGVSYCWCYQGYKLWLSKRSPWPTFPGAMYRTTEVLCTCHQGSEFVAWSALTSCGENGRITAPHSQQPWAAGRELAENYNVSRRAIGFFWLRTTVNLKSSSVRRHNGQVMFVCAISNIQDVSRLRNSLGITIPCREGSRALRTCRTVTVAKYFILFFTSITHLNKCTLSY